MLKSYQLQNGGLKGAPVATGDPIPEGSLWLDLLNPTLEERRSVDPSWPWNCRPAPTWKRSRSPAASIRRTAGCS